jgi:hypothetical protein
VVERRAQPAPKPVPQRRNQIVTNFVRKGLSYNQVAATGVQQQPTPAPRQQAAAPRTSQKFDIDAVCNNLFGKNLPTCLEKVSAWAPKFDPTADISQQRTTMVKLLVDLCIN